MAASMQAIAYTIARKLKLIVRLGLLCLAAFFLPLVCFLALGAVSPTAAPRGSIAHAHFKAAALATAQAEAQQRAHAQT